MAIAYPEAACIRDQMVDAPVGNEIVDVRSLDIAENDGSWQYGSEETSL